MDTPQGREPASQPLPPTSGGNDGPSASSAPLAPALRLQDVSVTLGGVSILEHVDATIARGQTTAIIGPNGAGKTTLLQTILGVLPYTGRIEFLDPAGRPTPPRLGYVPQLLNIDRQAALSVVEFMALDTQIRPVWLGISEEVRETAARALDRLEARHLLDRPLGRLSGGELQRVLLAAALHRQPEVILLDEPVSGVDVAGGHLFCDILADLAHDRQLTILMVSHDLSVVTQHASYVLCLNRTITCQGAAIEVLTSERLLDLFGQHSGLYHHTPHRAEHQCSHHHRPTHPPPSPAAHA
ncbi:MAG: Zinc ABC transporter, ATP-binding protein [Candidatus Ozemobacter sibiricus]|jgi:zinc transport system ATP-binding protein|uniref:Zinc ABC transporter, ATP-binding protein n=1 Tax=Candidatus Ozemobacter sibiricus TaxID=2268124 RepID=A0A367ZTE8_9BACT|nr:MAG: Zinc ABC transporter, ATP-binding protein [Candidatus Ozemobacter sibiricus]